MLIIAENSIQLIFTAVCTVMCAYYMLITKKHEWVLLGLASFVYFLGDLYMQLFMIFYGDEPFYSYIPWVGYYACYLFFLLLIFEIRDTRPLKNSIRTLWFIPVFTFGMCVFFMNWGDYISNIVAAIIMWLVFWADIDGLISIHKDTGENHANRNIYIIILIFCLLEYTIWTISCFSKEYTILNPYFLCEILLSVSFLLLPSALRKAVEA